MMEVKRGFLLQTLLSVVLLLFVSCARIGTPDGGPYDETPPKVVRTSPKLGASNVKHAKKITIEFDEIIKIDNAMEKVVISPPQIEQPEIEANGKKVTISLLDSLKPNTTYTIDFADAIVDNNEGNPYGDFAFTFSTGEQVDTFQVSGHVLDASNLEPIKGMLVGLYKLDSLSTDGSLPDSIFRTQPFERISRTDSRGHFVIKGLSMGQYRAFALKDANQNYVYDQRSEMVAFSERILTPSSKPDIRPDTVWHDSIHYDSIVMTPYTHFYPDDIVLTAFESAIQDRYLLKSERPTPWKFTLYFTAPSDTLPRLTGLNFDAEQAFVIDASQHNDTLNYWVRDSLIYNLDTLSIQLDFFATDTTGNLALTTDTLHLVSKLTKARIARQQQEKFEEWAKQYRQQVKAERRAARKAEKEAGKEGNTKDDDGEDEDEATEASPDEEVATAEDDTETAPDESVTEPDKSSKKEGKEKKKKKRKKDDDDIEVPPMPEEFLTFKTINAQSMDPDKNIDFEFEEPLDTFDVSKIHFSIQVDSVFQPTKFLFRPVPGHTRTYRLYAEWEPDTTYKVEIDTAAFVNIYGKRNEAQKRIIKMKSMSTYSTLFVALQGTDPIGANWSNAYVQLLDGSDKAVKTIRAKNAKADFYFLTPGTYYLRLFCDTNGNGQWDTGDYDLQQQPEPVFYYPGALTLKAQWEITQEWNPTALSLPKQKPEKITKQKPDKEKNIKNRNAERNNKK